MSILRRLRRLLGAESKALPDMLAERDELYSRLFGPPYRGAIATPTAELLERMLPEHYPWWLHNGVYAFEPTPSRPCWTFVTAGLSTPWEVEDEDPTFDEWAPSLLNKVMAYQLGASEGLIKGRRIRAGERIPLAWLGARPTGSAIVAVATAELRDPAPSVTLLTGTVSFLQLVGITAEEYAWSVERNVEALIAALAADPLLTTRIDRTTLPPMAGTPVPEDLRKRL
jgi:hypothetical protein